MDRRNFFTRTLAASLAAAFPATAGEVLPRRILLRSAWQTVNIGDIGHTPGVLALLEKQLPKPEVRLWPGNIGDGVKPMLQKRFPKLIITDTPESREAAFKECDFLLHGSGPSLVAATQVAEWREKTGKPYGVFGITVTTVEPKTKDILDGASFVFFRDTSSLQLAKDKGVKSPVMAFGPDGAFSVDLRADDTATAFLKKHGLEEGKFLCTIPRLRNTPYWKIRNKTMTDLDKAKDRENGEMKEKDHAMVREALVAFLRKTDHRLLVCPEDRSHMEVGKEMFVDQLPKEFKDRVVWRPDYWLTDEALSVYVRSIGLLSMDMHSPIMALGNGIPAIVCRFKQQTSKGQMWADIGLGDWLFNLDVEKDGANITKALLDMTADLPAAKKKAAKALEVVRERQREMVGTLKKQLDKAARDEN